MKNLLLIRGLPGSGKSTLANYIARKSYFETDKYFMKDNEYKWDGSKLKQAHEWCQNVVRIEMLTNQNQPSHEIIVANTFTQEKEMTPYIELAKEYGYQVTTLIVENRHGNQSIHNVPEESRIKMKNRFEVKL